MKKFLCVFFALLLTLLSFSGCKNSKSVSQTTAIEKNPENPEFYISAELISQYKITRADECGGSVIKSVNNLKAAIKNIYEVDLLTGDDFYREGYNTIEEYEILVGETSRDESKDFLSNLRSNDYGYTLVGKKLVIAGHTPETTALAVEHFISNVLKERSEDCFFSVKDKYTYNDKYPVNTVKLNGISIGQYTIVYPYLNKNHERSIAEKLRNAIMDFSGYCLRVENDKEAYDNDYEIIIGNSSHLDDAIKQMSSSLSEDKYLLTSKEKLVWISSPSIHGMINAVEDLTQKLIPTDGSSDSDLVLNEGFSATYTKETLSAMSFNVYIGNITEARIERVTAMIKNHMPDTFGVQEANITWINAISEALPEYAYVGEGRDGGGTNGEYSAVFYRKDKFDLIDSGTKWLSDTPEVKGSKYSESAYVRIMTYAVLEEKSTKIRFIHVNTHIDNASSAAREKQTEVLLKEIAKLPDHPVILTGDFNCEEGSAPLNSINKSFFDSSTKAAVSSKAPTFHGYEGNTKIIDFIFFSRAHAFAIDLYKVCNEQMGDTYASDHHPVYAEYIIIN